MSSRTESAVQEESASAWTRSGVEPDAEERLMVSGLKLSGQAQPFDLAFRAGEIVGLAGLEGQGQVSFIRAVAGIDRAVSGRIYLSQHGTRQAVGSARSAERAGVAYVTGDRKAEALFPNLSVLENFGILGYRRRGFPVWLHRSKTGQEDVQ